MRGKEQRKDLVKMQTSLETQIRTMKKTRI